MIYQQLISASRIWRSPDIRNKSIRDPDFVSLVLIAEFGILEDRFFLRHGFVYAKPVGMDFGDDHAPRSAPLVGTRRSQ